MGLEDRNSEHQREIVDKFIDTNANYAMTTRDYVCRPSANGVTGPITYVLPPVAEAKGRFYSILALDADVVNTITITHKDDSEFWVSDIVFTIAGDRGIFYSDGRCWHPLAIVAGIHPY